MKLKVGCLIFIAIPLALFVIFWITSSYIPAWHIKNAKESTKKYSVAYRGDDENILMGLTDSYDLSKDRPSEFLCDVKLMSQIILESCVVHSASQKPDEVTNKIWVKISDKHFNSVINVTLNTGQYASPDRDSSVAYSDESFFIIWKKVNKLKDLYSINLIVIDRVSKEETLKSVIYEKDFSINNIASCFDSENKKLLLAWNDWSYSRSEYLFLGVLDIRKLKSGVINFSHKQILSRDKWENRNPYFILDNEKVYLAHSTGDSWGLFSHEGKKGIGVSLINQMSEPTEYRMVASDYALNKISKIEKGIVFYTQMDSKGSKISEVRTIPFDSAYQPFNYDN